MVSELELGLVLYGFAVDYQVEGAAAEKPVLEDQGFVPVGELLALLQGQQLVFGAFKSHHEG